MKRLILFTLLVLIFFYVTPALATALKSIDSGLISYLNSNFFATEPVSLVFLGSCVLVIANLTKRRIKG